jgi:uncharacterized Fe-S cluster-containing radical SAM superfamily enzyme
MVIIAETLMKKMLKHIQNLLGKHILSGFSYKDIYIENGKRVLEVNVLTEKNCNFDCIFCSIGRSKDKVDTQKSFDEKENSYLKLLSSRAITMMKNQFRR